MLSPLDLKNKMMEPKKRKYYDKDETDDYLELVMEQYKQLYDENLELQKNVKSLNDGVQYYRSIENTMQKALVLAEKTAKETKDAAQLKAEAIEKDANTKADKIVAEAEQEYDKLKEKCLSLVQQFNQYKMQLKQVASAQLELITSDSFDVYSPEIEAIRNEKDNMIAEQSTGRTESAKGTDKNGDTGTTRKRAACYERDSGKRAGRFIGNNGSSGCKKRKTSKKKRTKNCRKIFSRQIPLI